jgi:hypothetical protein
MRDRDRRARTGSRHHSIMPRLLESTTTSTCATVPWSLGQIKITDTLKDCSAHFSLSGKTSTPGLFCRRPPKRGA